MMRLVCTVLVYHLLCVLAAHGSSQKCLPLTLTKMSGEIQSSGYPDTPYLNSQRCRFNIIAPPGYFIEITFTDFKLETQAPNGRRRDFVKVIDAPGRPPLRAENYSGTIVTPFIFVTSSNRAALVFITNKRVRKRGFHAVYRMRKAHVPEYCEYPEFKNGHARLCELGIGEADLYSKCNIFCDPAFELRGDQTAICDTYTGNWAEPPSCVLNEEILEICLNNIKNVECLYSPNDLTDYLFRNTENEFENEDGIIEVLEEFGADLGELEMDVPQVGARSLLIGARSSQQKTKCDKRLCAYDKRNRRFAYSCKTYSAAVARKRGFGPEKTYNIMLHCFSCQSNGCVPVVIFA